MCFFWTFEGLDWGVGRDESGPAAWLRDIMEFQSARCFSSSAGGFGGRKAGRVLLRRGGVGVIAIKIDDHQS